MNHKRTIQSVVNLTVLGIFLSILLYHSVTFAAEKRKFPHGCRDVGYEFQDGLLVLIPASEDNPQTLYLIHNLAGHHLKLRIKKAAGDRYSPVYENIIKPYEWAAFATDMGQVHFTCSETQDEEGEYSSSVSCDHLLELCQYTRAKFAEHNSGNYWVIHSSSSMQGAVRGSIKNGILLRW